MAVLFVKTRWSSFLFGAIGVATITVVLIPLRGTINSTTIGFGFLLGVLFVAIIWGSMPALFASVLAMLSFNFFFLPPFHTFTIADPQNWVALTAFFITALAVGQLSARAKRRAEEAEDGRIKIRRLYEDLQNAFGSWNNNANNLRSANRNRNTPDNRNNNNGVRVVAVVRTLSRQSRRQRRACVRESRVCSGDAGVRAEGN